MPISLSEAVQTLLAGNVLSWQKYGAQKAGQVQLASADARRLLHYLLTCDRAKVAEAKEELFDGLVAAWQNSAFDPAVATKPRSTTAHTGTWRLLRMESEGFGGLNLPGGPKFLLEVNGENWCLEGQNGSGKTSLTSAIIWALTGFRCRDQDGVVMDDGRRVPVHDATGLQIGDWPPIVAYPAAKSKLNEAAETWVRLTFQNDTGDTAVALRRLVAPPTGAPMIEEQIDPALLSASQFLEIGLLMPARLSRVGFGERSQSIYDAVKLLTGLDHLADIGEGAANFSHAAKRFLKYGVDNSIVAIGAKMDLLLKRAATEAAKVAFELKFSTKREDQRFAQELRDTGGLASAQAAAHLSVLTLDVASTLDTRKAADRIAIKNAVSTARGILQQGVKGVTTFDAWAALKAAHSDANFQKLSDTIGDYLVALEEAIAWHNRQSDDVKLRLKALASRFFVSPGHAHEDAECPLCESKLSGEKRKALAAELAELKISSVAAERKLGDACAGLEKEIRELLPQGVSAHFALLVNMEPREAFMLACKERFQLDAPFATALTGIAEFTDRRVKELAEKLPSFESVQESAKTDEAVAAQELRGLIRKVGRLITLVQWWSYNRQAFLDAWNGLRGVADKNDKFPVESLEGKLSSLELALENSAPLDELASALNDAASEAERWLPIYRHQQEREAIARSLDPIKNLRTLVNVETSASISQLSERMKSVLDRIHFRERLSFGSAALSKRSVLISGSFDPGIEVDAATVANSSWLRAILWAFIFALREKTIEALGANPFPLMLLDDPQVTFDPRNKRKWSEEIARLANADPTAPQAMQLLLITHERQFFQFLVNMEKLAGQQGLVVRLNATSQVATIVNGSSLARSYQKAHSRNDDAMGHRYVFEVRTYCEDMLKIMLRAEGPDICDCTLDKLATIMRKLRESSIAPFNRAPFDRLIHTIAGGGGAKPMKCINEAHHKFDGTIGVAQATDVKVFWETTLQTQIHTCFKLYAEYEAYSGESRIFPWMDNLIPFPAGNSAKLGNIGLAYTGVAAAAKTDGRSGDGLITIQDLAQSKTIRLHSHDTFQLVAGTLDPVAGIGDVLIVSKHLKVKAKDLVVVAFGDQLLARRYNETDLHPYIAVLTGQATDPCALPQPVIVPIEKVVPRKIVGTLFTASKLPIPSISDNIEFTALSDSTIVSRLCDNSRLFVVSGRSAEPVALDGQFIMTQPVPLTSGSLREMDGRLVIAVDDTGARFFKRFRRQGPIIVLESLNPDGSAPAEVLSLDGELGLPRLTDLLEVVGVLFELPA